MAHGNQNIGINTAGTASQGDAASGFGNVLGNLLGGAGALHDSQQQQERIDDVSGRAEFQDQGFNFGGLSGQINADGSTANLGAAGQQQFDFLQGRGQDLISGGQGFDFNQFSQNNFGGALQGVANTSGGINPTAFGQLGNIAGAAQGQAGFAGGLFNQGPGQDFSGGAQGAAFQQGFQNLGAAGNQDQLRSQALGTLRQEVQGSGLLEQAINRLQNRQFSQGRLGSTGGAQESQGFLNAVSQQDLGLQNAAFGIGNQQGQLLSQIGGQQLSLGANLFGQNQQTFNNLGNQSQGFLGLGAGVEGQQFGQNIAAGQFGRQGALNNLGAQTGVFGQGQGAFAQNAGVGLDALGLNLGRDQLTSDTVLGLRNSEADRIAASGQSADALLGQTAGGAGSGAGSLFGGLAQTALGFIPGGSFLGGLFG